MKNKINTVKILKIQTTEKFAVIIRKFEQGGLTLVKCINDEDVDGMANSVELNQTAPLGPVCSGSTLFARTCLSENLGTLR